MSAHPVSRDSIRAYLAQASIFRIVLLFVLVVVALAMVNALVMALLNGGTDALAASNVFALALEGVIGLLGGDVDDSYQALHFSRMSLALLTLFSVLLPALLLGAVVYKVLMPRKRLTVFRRKAHLVGDSARLESCFYVASDLDVFDLQIKTYVRIYKPMLASGTPNPYPLKTIPLAFAGRQLPQPHSYVPTRVDVPVVPLTVKDFENPVAQHLDGKLGILAGESEIEAIIVDGHVIARGRDEFCELLVIVEGKMPQAQSSLLESECYDLFKHVRLGETPAFQTRFETSRQHYVVTNWHEFDPA